jgi:tRNA(fMet)-specific endonuclease VapC
MILLDTDSLTLLMKGHSKIVGRVSALTEPIAITIITRIEILQGRFASVMKADDGAKLLLAQHWLDQNERYLSQLTCVPFDNSAAVEFDRLRSKTTHRKVGRADMLIASIALAQRSRLITRNLKDFERIPNLAVENWAD